MMSDFTIRSLQLSSNGSAGTLASSCTNDPESVMFTLQLAIITVLGAVMCLFSLVAQAGFIYFNIDQGEIAQIQAYSVWCASLAVIGHVNNAFGLSSTSDSACLAEAVTSNFGELALVLWQMGTAVIAIAITYPEWLRSGNNRRNLIISMHLLVWIPSLVTTIIPWSQGSLFFISIVLFELVLFNVVWGVAGLLGYYGVESSDFCWFIPDNKPWELGQFYIPLYLASFVALSTFVFLVFRIKQLTGSITLSEASVVPSDATPSARSQTINIQKSSEQRQILIRLAFQLFATSFVFLPDRFRSEISVSCFM
jgi:hypothetical protein